VLHVSGSGAGLTPCLLLNARSGLGDEVPLIYASHLQSGISYTILSVAMQVAFAIICLGTSAYWVDSLGKYRIQLHALNFALFASITGAALSGLMLAAPHIARLQR
jgi:hypothetical protein